VFINFASNRSIRLIFTAQSFDNIFEVAAILKPSVLNFDDVEIIVQPLALSRRDHPVPPPIVDRPTKLRFHSRSHVKHQDCWWVFPGDEPVD